MKKLLSLLSLFILISILSPTKVHAFDLTVGAATWYTWWDYKQKQTIANNFYTDTDMKPALLAGPVLSLKFNDDFNLSLILLASEFAGNFDCEKSGYEVSGGGGTPTPFTNKGTAYRFDVDITLNYRLNDYFKVFAGAKMLHTSTTMGGGEFESYGPGLGLGFTFPILDNLFLLANLSGFYLWGNEKNYDGGGNFKFKTNDYGINSTLALAYYIAPASTTLSLGGRYQYIETNYDANEDWTRKCTFYGVTLSVTYTFSF